MRNSKVSTPAHEACSELLGFGSVSRPERQGRVKRSVNAKVGPKPLPPEEPNAIQETCSELIGFRPVRSDRTARIKRSVRAKAGEKSPPPPQQAS
jgi:hypothetical protein